MLIANERMKFMKQKKFLAFSLTLALFSLGLMILIRPEKIYSENENRNLHTFPSFSVSSLLDGTLQKELSNALTDQFPNRESWMAFGTRVKLLSGRKDIGDVYIGKDHYYFEKVTNHTIQTGNFKSNLSAVQNLAKTYPSLSVSMMLVPSSGVILSDKLPEYAAMYDSNKMYEIAAKSLSGICLINPSDFLRKQYQTGKQIYYKTDHHWTSYGAYIGYQAFMKERGAYGEYRARKVTDSFLGTLYSKTLDSHADADMIELPEISSGAEIKINGTPSRIYDKSKLQGKDKYQVFQGGNFGMVEINGTGKGTLLLLKDSFANSFVPYLTTDFEKIVMIDLRYYDGTVKNFLNTENIDQMLVLYELNNFALDNNLVKLYR